MFVHWKKAFVRLSGYVFAILNSVKYFPFWEIRQWPWPQSLAKADDEGGWRGLQETLLRVSEEGNKVH